MPQTKAIVIKQIIAGFVFVKRNINLIVLLPKLFGSAEKATRSIIEKP